MSQQPNSFVNGPATTDYHNVSLKDEFSNKEGVRVCRQGVDVGKIGFFSFGAHVVVGSRNTNRGRVNS